jgi:hypothetical protein
MFITMKKDILNIAMKLHRNSNNFNDIKANVSVSFLTFSSDNLIVNNPLFEVRLELATEGLELKKLLSKTNALTIANYILTMKTELNYI